MYHNLQHACVRVSECLTLSLIHLCVSSVSCLIASLWAASWAAAAEEKAAMRS